MTTQSQETVYPTARALRGPLMLAICCFLIWGLAYGLLDVLNKHFQETLHVDKAQSSWLQIAYFGAYLLLSLPAGVWVDRLRRRPRMADLPLDAAAQLQAPEQDADPLVDRRLRELLTRLPPMPRAVLLLRYQEDLDPAEIARALGLPVNTVKSHLRRSLALLRGRSPEVDARD